MSERHGQQTCGNCRWSAQSDADARYDGLYCFYDPPRIVGRSMFGRGERPYVREKEFCHNYEPREASK